MSISINTDRYSKFISEVNTLLPTGTRVIVTIYKDKAGTQKATDVNGSPYENKQFASLAYQYPTESEPGFITLSFNDESVFKLNDGDETHWYFINEISTEIQHFV
jgi:hypothetical protein